MLSIPVAFVALGNANVKVSPTSHPEDLRGWGSTRRATYGHATRAPAVIRAVHTSAPPAPRGDGGHAAAWPGTNNWDDSMVAVRESSEYTSQERSVIDGMELLGSRRDLPVSSSIPIFDI